MTRERRYQTTSNIAEISLNRFIIQFITSFSNVRESDVNKAIFVPLIIINKRSFYGMRYLLIISIKRERCIQEKTITKIFHLFLIAVKEFCMKMMVMKVKREN
jgi:hypothetical protein